MFTRLWYKALPALLMLLGLGGCDPLGGLGKAVENLVSSIKFKMP